MMDLPARIESLFEDFDNVADPILDEAAMGADCSALGTGLAIRLVQFALGHEVTPQQSEMIAQSLMTELTTLRRNIHNDRPHGKPRPS